MTGNSATSGADGTSDNFDQSAVLGLVADVRFGRMRLDNVLGSEARQLPVPMRVEYWNSGGFMRPASCR